MARFAHLSGYFLKPEGHAAQFATEKEAVSFREWLDRGQETGCIDMFYNSDNDVWVVTQYVRIMTTIDDQEVFESYAKSMAAIAEANRYVKAS